jgi:diguanylate cyclase (GGDEF)-like protein
MRRIGSIRVLVCWVALSAILPAQQYVFRAFRQAEGLKNLAVNAIAKDRDGFLWVATENGVYRFRGSDFERFGPEQGIAEIEIRDVVADPDGTVWIGTLHNFYHWDGQKFLPSGRDSARIRAPWAMAVEDARHLLIMDNRRLYRLEHDAAGKTLSYVPVFSDAKLASVPQLGMAYSVNVVNQLAGRRIWVGAGNKLYSFMDGGLGQSPGCGDAGVAQWGAGQGLIEDLWRSVYLDRAGTLWLAGVQHVMALPSGAAHLIDRSIPGSDSESVYGHFPLIEDREGRIIVPSDDGVVRWNGSGWQHIGQTSGLERSANISGMVFDAAGNLWLASRGKGLYIWAGYEDWEGWGDAQNLPSAIIWSIDPGPVRILVGTEHGPVWIDRRNGSTGVLSSVNPWIYGQVESLGINSDASLWVGTYAGNLLRINSRTGATEKTVGLTSHLMNGLQISPQLVFFSTGEGLYEREGNAAPHRIPAVDALLGDSTEIVAGCAGADGTDWFLTGDRLLRLKNGAWTLPPIDGMPQLRGSLSALSCASDGAVWATGQQSGTWRMTPSGERLNAWQLAMPPEFQKLAPLAILADRRGWVWLGTDIGLLAWNGQSWRHITQENGLIWNDISQGAVVNDADGSLWVGTAGGLAHLLHPERVFDPIALTVSLTELRRGETSYLGARQIILPWAGPPLIFRISSPTMRNRSELALKIRMVGFQSEWMDTRDGNATFARLPPGRYMFMAMACNPGLNACSTPLNVDIKVLPPWWNTIWFYGVCILAFLLLLGVASHLYARQMRARSRHLESLVSERTRELEASREQLRVQATHDGLTGMLNRTAILRTLAAEMDRARRENRTVVVALIDLDHFKRINDSHGHMAGDDALRWFAAAVDAAIRPYDHAGRYGGEEFLLVLTQIPREIVENRLVRLQAAISNLQVSTRGAPFSLNCSMGATVFDPSSEPASVESLLTIADRALYAAKAEGRNRVVFRTPGHSGSQQEEPAQSFSPS